MKAGIPIYTSASSNGSRCLDALLEQHNHTSSLPFVVLMHSGAIIKPFAFAVGALQKPKL
jgi:hypothetical protein